MNQYKHRLFLAGVALLVTLMTTAGCKFMAIFNRHTDSSSQRVAISLMPSVTSTDVDATGRKLTAAGLTVMIKRPEVVIRNKSGEKSFALPEIIRPFQPSQWNHMIAAQDPAPGTPVGTESVVTLTAGIHHGAGPFRPWLDAHGGSVNLRGEQRCRDCHIQQYCSDCHDTIHDRADHK